MDAIKVSLIIPVYNVDRYLSECLDSIIAQSLNDKEIIIVNDGSTDRSLDIAQRYSERYSYIKVFSKKNGGQSSARNFGLDVARGEYVFFMDADDYLNREDREVMEKFYGLCKEHNLDVIRGKYHIYFERENGIRHSVDFATFKYLNQGVKARDYFNEAIITSKYEVTPWLGLYNREFLINNNLFFQEGVQMEDHLFTLKCLTTNRDALIMQCNNDFYTYRRRPNSTTTNSIVKNIKDIKDVSELMLKYIATQSFDKYLCKNAYKAVSALIYQATSIYGRLSPQDKSQCRDILSKAILKFSIRHSYDNRQKLKIFLFTYFRFIVNIVYYFKLKSKKYTEEIVLKSLL